MKKFLCIIITILLTVTSVFGLVACGEEPVPDKDNQQTAEETGKYFIKDSSTEYKLLTKSAMGVDLSMGVDQFKKILYEATGVNIQSVYDDRFDENAKYISCGQTSLFESSGIAVNNDLGLSGFEIKTVGDNVFIYGLNDTSTAYGMFEFLSRTVGFDCIVDGYYVEDGITDVKLYKYDITDIPDIEMRTTNLDYVTADSVKSLMLRTEAWNTKIMEVGGMSMHNALFYLPLENFYEEHPLWYADSKTQLSYTAHGDKEERDLMVQTVAEALKRELINQPNKLYVKLSGSDDNTYDESEAQKEINRIYGAESASAILFANDVRAIIQDWFESDEGKPYARDFIILVSAYLRTDEAPVSFNEATGKYEGNNGIKCAEGVGIDYAPINIDYTHSLYAPINKPYLEAMKKWGALTDSLFIWTYGTFAHEFLCPYDNYFYLQEMYQLQKEIGVRYQFSEVSDTGTAMDTCYGNYRLYMELKLAWDADQDVNALTKKFFKEYFGKVSDDMYEVFEDMRVYLAYIKDNVSGYSGTMVNQFYPLKENLWSKEFLLQEYNDYTKVIEKLGKYYVEGSSEYLKYYKRIANERLSPLYMLIELYDYNTSEEEMLKFKHQFKDDCILIGGGRGHCNGDSLMDAKYVEWGIA